MYDVQGARESFPAGTKKKKEQMALGSEALQIEAKIAAAFEASEQRCRR